ncbi:hypothetical protein PQU92_04095 [Asticcacaulis sp. BYS171W]|uniref:Uncharacterized protein n=1 Tax=Asticcacaulis aquaticus TaxID=2984212 RepID=A0ABT5HQU7_9CAUL|nr:hypothetical protein [Asticcacaulis aquaticus]MDC7682442.1 hypothetical protein [Asticcacaulis aquaticus]
MKRVLTKKPQFEKTVLAERPKRNLKFSHTAVEAPVVPELGAEPAPVAAVTAGPVELDVPAYEWTSESAVKPATAVIKKPAKSVGDHIVSIVLPVIGFAVLGLIVAALAKAGGYDAAFLASRF